MDQIKKDKRFAHIAKDSRFHKMPSKFRKVKIDNRFKSMFSDKRFKMKYEVDKRGKLVKTSTNENLKNYYELDSSDDDKSDSGEDDEENDNSDEKEIIPSISDSKIAPRLKSASTSKDIKSSKASDKSDEADREENDSSSDSSSDEDFQATSDAIKQGIDLARGEGDISSSSDEDGSDDDNDGDDADVDDHQWGELAADATEAEEVTARLALCNMDWDRIKAQDILILVNSFKPSGGVIHHVKIYPSEYGLKRIEEDSRLGPAELRSAKDHPDDSSDEEDSEIRREKLRQYQINRLKYYYAVITCDSPETADAIYEQCDGLEYETSSSKIDLRFIPDDMEFDHEPTSTADRILDGVNYKPASFVTTALNQTKVNLTWEETDPERLKLTMKKFSREEVDEMDLKDYLASDSDDDENDGEKVEVDKFRSLLGGEASKEKVQDEDANMEMEISWEPGLKAATEKAVKNKSKGGQTPWEKYLEKRNEKKRQKLDEKMKTKQKQKESETSDAEEENEDDIPEGVDMNDPFFKDAVSDDEGYEKLEKVKKKKKEKGKKKKKTEAKTEEADPDLDLLVMDEDDHKQHFSLEQIMKNEQQKKKKKKRKNMDGEKAKEVEDTFSLDLGDDRFAAIYTSSAYNIDPSAKDYKKTKAMEAIVEEKIKRRAHQGEPSRKAPRLDAASEERNIETIQSLVKSVKAKAKMAKPNKKGK